MPFTLLRILAPRARGRKWRTAFSAVGVGTMVFAAQVAHVSPAAAQSSAYARGRLEAGQDLAQRSLECLHRGEDESGTEARLAAYREGLDLARRAIAADEMNADAHFACFANNGRIMLLEGVGANPFTLLTANRELDRALALNPNHADALAAKGGMYRQLPYLLGGSLTKAADYLSRSVALDPDACGARIELAETYRDMGHPERSVPLLEKAAEVAERLGKGRQLHEARELLSQVQTSGSK